MTLLVGTDMLYFNIVVFLVADISFLNDILGHASSTMTFGCLHCDCPQQSWSQVNPPSGNTKTVAGMVKRGCRALSDLGHLPDKESKEYKRFIQDNLGQWVDYLAGFSLRVGPVGDFGQSDGGTNAGGGSSNFRRLLTSQKSIYQFSDQNRNNFTKISSKSLSQTKI